jgi:hypothetical protein
VSGHDIFISYSREDRPAARHFAESFAREGFTVWWDAALRSGQTFDEIIEQELRAAKAAVVLWSPRSVASRWVRAEATLADRNNKLVPVIIESCTLPIIFELTQAANLARWTGDASDAGWQTLISDLRRLIGNGEEEKPAPAQPKQASKIAPSEPDKEELMAALARIGDKAGHDLSKPTEQEEHLTQFYRQSDEHRALEGDTVHCLLRLDDDENETSFIVGPGGLRIGRSAPADVIVMGIGVSRSHCEVDLAGGKLRVTDLNSTNGTYVNDKRIVGSADLPKGALLRVGNISFRHDVFTRAEMAQRSDPAAATHSSGATIARAANS